MLALPDPEGPDNPPSDAEEHATAPPPAALSSFQHNSLPHPLPRLDAQPGSLPNPRPSPT
jgi:hypothetical protein